MKQIILTGDRPTGRLHVGHYVGSLKERVRLQNTGKFDEISNCNIIFLHTILLYNLLSFHKPHPYNIGK